MALWLEIGGHEDINRSDIQVVKCVLVGDSGVGKTRLTCARACGTRYTLQELVGRHVPTVWAIDHYRKDKEVVYCLVLKINVRFNANIVHFHEVCEKNCTSTMNEG